MLASIMKRWANFVYRFPFLVVLLAFAVAGLGGYLATDMRIKSNFAALLPENAQSVIDLKEIEKRMGGMGTLIISVEGGELKQMQRFADDLVAELEKYPKKDIRFIDYKIDDQKAFFEKNKYLYVDLQELSDLRDELNDRISKEKLKATGMYIDLEEEEGEEKEETNFSKKRDEFREKEAKFDKYIDGYLTNKEGTSLIVVVKVPGDATGVSDAKRITGKVEETIAKLDPAKYDVNIDVALTGNMMTLIEEYYALREDILVVSNICVGLVLLAVALYYRSIRMTLILCIGLLAGLFTTFGIVQLHIGYLTASTAFLASIVAGNGINFGIYFLARYMEERRRGDPVPDTLARALTGVVRSVATASFAAGASYISLIFTDFRGFSQFGFIGGVGMVICLSFALTLNPALTVLMERYLPFKNETEEEAQKGRVFSKAVAWIIEHYPKRVFVGGLILVFVAGVMLVFFLRDPYEYNFRNLRNQYSRTEGSGARSTRAEDILGERSSPHVILADSFEQVPLVEEALKPYIATGRGKENGLIKEIQTINDYLPGTEQIQQVKIRILMDIRRLITTNDFDFLDAQQRKDLKDMTPPEDLKPIVIDDLPEKILRKYIEEDGTRGTQIYVYMNDGMSVWDGRDLMDFAAVVRKVELKNGETIRSSGHAVIFSDMLTYIAEEGPTATLTAFLFVSAVVIIAFRKPKHWLVLISAMAAGVTLMMGVGIAFNQKINFLNFIAIPIQFGIGVDYSVNIYSRFLEEGRGSIGYVLRRTGGAVLVTSSTTIIGYGALWLSLNGAINSFGTLANIGEFTCLAAAVFIMPAYLALFRGGLAKKD